MCRVGVTGACEQDAALGELGEARPDLLPVDPPRIPVTNRAAGERSKVAARAGLGETLAPGLGPLSIKGTISAASSGRAKSTIVGTSTSVIE